MMDSYIYIIDGFLFIILGINVLYLLIFSVASCRCRVGNELKSDLITYKRFVILIPAYKEDLVIMNTVQKCLSQDYPADKFDVVVISDHMTQDTNLKIKSLKVKLIQVDFKESTNTKAIKAALEYLDRNAYEVAVILDADNIINSAYLSEINAAFSVPGVQVVQTHRIAKNLDTDMAYLDAASEEINNSIFRLGHVKCGLSAALIGSGMAFEYSLLFNAMMTNHSVGGFDRVLEMKLLIDGIYFHYLPDTYVLDEKIRKVGGFAKQRRRWLAAQYYSLIDFFPSLYSAICKQRWDFCDKLFQQMMFSRLLLIGIIFVILLITSISFTSLCFKWGVLFFLLLFGITIAVPRYFWNRRLIKAVFLLPYLFVLMFANLFLMRSAKKRFIHTEHGIAESV